MESLPDLRSLSLEGCRKLSDEALDLLTMAGTNLTVRLSGPRLTRRLHIAFM